MFDSIYKLKTPFNILNYLYEINAFVFKSFTHLKEPSKYLSNHCNRTHLTYKNES